MTVGAEATLVQRLRKLVEWRRPDSGLIRQAANRIETLEALLPAAKAALAFYDGGSDPHIPGEAKVLDALDAAIAKAEGRAALEQGS